MKMIASRDHSINITICSSNNIYVLSRYYVHQRLSFIGIDGLVCTDGGLVRRFEESATSWYQCNHTTSPLLNNKVDVIKQLRFDYETDVRYLTETWHEDVWCCLRQVATWRGSVGSGACTMDSNNNKTGQRNVREPITAASRSLHQTVAVLPYRHPYRRRLLSSISGPEFNHAVVRVLRFSCIDLAHRQLCYRSLQSF